MFKFVDGAETEEIFEGFAYTNNEGSDEHVLIDGGGAVIIRDSNHDSATIYIADIPKLIKALQAAYEYLKGESI